MRFTLDVHRTARALALGAVAILAAAIATPLTAAAAPAKRTSTAAPTPNYISPDVGPTSKNLQESFGNEISTKERYLAAASVAVREGYPDVARLFRACARAEQAHADLHVRAIARNGEEAKALLQQLSLGTTAENLKLAADLEAYEADMVYPAFLAKAREDRQPEAVRSITLALAAERQHARLMKGALETLDRRLSAPTFHVCSQCGNTLRGPGFRKCPHCFAGANRFLAVN